MFSNPALALSIFVPHSPPASLLTQLASRGGKVEPVSNIEANSTVWL